MKVLYYSWYENSENDMFDGLKSLGLEVIKYNEQIRDYEEDEIFAAKLERMIRQEHCDVVITFDFFPVIAKVTERLLMKYISWVYDCPHYSLYSPAVLKDNVYLFLFDKELVYDISSFKKKNVYYMPLPVNVKRIDRCLENTGFARYLYDISFVGSLYENNMYRNLNYLPDYLKGYIDGIISGQRQIYGYNFVEELIYSSVEEELSKYIKLNMPSSYLISDKKIFANMISAEITHRDRLEYLTQLAKQHKLDLFTNSNADLCDNIVNHGVVTYEEQMPQVFNKTKINLNFTLRSIKSGIPLRALDIMGAGGFLLSNYQNELAQNFENGVEMVCFDGKDDLIEKVRYYLENDNERENIALKGYEKVKREYSYEVLLGNIFEIAGS